MYSFVKNLLVIFSLLFSLSIGAHKINAYKFIHISETGNVYGIEKKLTRYFEELGFTPVASYNIEDMSSTDKGQLLIANYEWNIVYGSASTLLLTLSDITGSIIFKGGGQGNSMSARGDMSNALRKIFKQINALHYAYDPNAIKISNNFTPSFASWSEDSIKQYLKSKSNLSLEGIYKNLSNNIDFYRIAILKEKDKYYGVIIDTENKRWEKGDTKMVLSYLDKQVYDVDYFNFKGKKINSLGKLENRVLTFAYEDEFGNSQSFRFLKIYPAKSTMDGTESSSTIDSGLRATGSGFVISGNVIATNNHVIDDAEKIKVVLNINGTPEEFNARVLCVDKTNDLALLTIKDSKFTPLPSAPYSINPKTVDVGTSVFSMGYPMSNVLGEEVKITDGLVSSKTGYEGDAVTYQISVPIQPGNSGGALFDKKGHLVGITNAGIPSAENVGYAIKSSYLINLIDSAPINIDLPKGNDLSQKELPEIVKLYRPYIAFIKIY